MPIRHNGTESEQVVISFLRITYTVAFCRFLTRCKRLAGKDGLLMVKLTAVDRRGACCTRYPLHPRRGVHTGGIWRHMDGYRFTPIVSGGKLYIELTGSFGGVIAACKAILSMSWSRFTRMPDNIALLQWSMAVHADPEILDVENLRLRGSLEAVRSAAGPGFHNVSTVVSPVW